MNRDVRTVGILIFDDVEVLDFCGPFEVFSVARPVGEHADGKGLFQAVTIAEKDRIIKCRGGLMVKPHFTTGDHPLLDILVVPGGQGTRRERLNEARRRGVEISGPNIHLSLQSTIFSDIYRRYGSVLYRTGAYLIEGRVEQDRRRGFSFVVERIEDLTEALLNVQSTTGQKVRDTRRHDAREDIA